MKCVSQKHELRFLSDFLFLRNTWREGKEEMEKGRTSAWQKQEP
jgi:hypothetical protein